MMVVIFTDVLFGGLGYGTLQPHCASKMASVPMLNYSLLPSFSLGSKNKDGKGCSARNRVKEKVSLRYVLWVPMKLSEFEMATLQ